MRWSVCALNLCGLLVYSATLSAQSDESALPVLSAQDSGNLGRPPPAPAGVRPPPQPSPPAGATVDAQPHYERQWYGWQILLLDTAAVGAFVALVGSDDGAWGWPVAGYVLAPSVVHAAHGRYGMIGASIGLRIGAPVMLGVIGLRADRDGCCTGISAGILLGLAIASLVDAFALSWEKVRVEQPPAAGLTLAPGFWATKHSAGFGLGGSL